MPKKAKQESQAEQSERFRREAQRLIDAGELSLTAAEEALDRVITAAAKKPPV